MSGLASAQFANPYHDENGRFTDADGNATGRVQFEGETIGRVQDGAGDAVDDSDAGGGGGGEAPELSADQIRAALGQPGPGIPVDTPEEALDLLAQGKKVELSSKDEVAILLDELRDQLHEAEAAGTEAPEINLCGVTVKGTSLFCEQNQGIPRIKMPQLSGKPLPGSRAAAFEPDKRGNVNLAEQFREHLQSKGVAITDDDAPASSLKASQNELQGAKVAGITKAVEDGKLDRARLFVSKDNYIVDGHHRWASIISADYRDGRDDKMPIEVARIDMSILELLVEANDFAEEWGIPQSAMTASAGLTAFAAASAPTIEGPMVEAAGHLKFRGVLAVEGIESGDGRVIAPEALTWRDLPLPLMAMFRNPDGGEGHAGAEIAGRIDRIWRDKNDPRIIRGSGEYDDTPVGHEAFRMLQKQMMRGVSVDLDRVIPEWVGGDPGEMSSTAGGVTFKAARIMGATQCAFPAFAEAHLEIADEALVAAAGVGAMFYLPYDSKEALVAGAGTGTGPELPPAAWFEKQQFTAPTPVRVSPDGQVSGHVATWGGFHIGYERRVEVPRSSTNYSEFRKGETLTAEGTMVATGPIIVDTVHPDLRMRASDAQAFYAHTGCAAADVAVYEDEFGIAIAGAVRPTATMSQVRALRGGDVSPDWRRVNGKPLECVAMLAVNNSGFKVPLALAASAGEAIIPGEVARGEYDVETGEVLALVAAGRIPRHHDGAVDLLRAEFDTYRAETERMMAELSQTILPVRAERARARAEAVLAKPDVVPLTARVRFPNAS